MSPWSLPSTRECGTSIRSRCSGISPSSRPPHRIPGGKSFNPETLIRLRRKHFDLMHIHAPFASSVLVGNINRRPRVPTVLTYHTKFDIDIAKRVPLDSMRRLAMRFLLDNVNAVDEVWVVTEGCGRALRNIGYKGGYTVMENGTDFAYGRAEDAAVNALREKYQIREDEFVFLFVGRMMWYKNVRLILDSLALLQQEGGTVPALLVGDGYDAPDIQAYSVARGLQDRAVFTGAIYDREALRAYYSLADLFLFPQPTTPRASWSRKPPPATAPPCSYGKLRGRGCSPC